MRRSRVLMATRAFHIGDHPPLDIPDRYSVVYGTFANFVWEILRKFLASASNNVDHFQ